MAWTNIANIKGPTGATGSQGLQGLQGVAGKPAYTNTTANFTVPAAGSTTVVNVSDTSWMVVGEIVWVATAAGGSNAGTMKITNITGSQVTLQT